MILFFQFFNNFLCRFASLFCQNIYCGKKKNCYYPLTTTQGDRSASCENVVSRRRPRLSPPPPEWRDHLFNRPQAIENCRLCLLVRTDILQNQLAVVGNLAFAIAFGPINRNLNCCSHC